MPDLCLFLTNSLGKDGKTRKRNSGTSLIKNTSNSEALLGELMTERLNGKKILIVDDEPDVLEALCELLDMCVIDYARNFDTAERLLKENSYDAAIFDIMGVEGYKLLGMAKERNVIAVM